MAAGTVFKGSTRRCHLGRSPPRASQTLCAGVTTIRRFVGSALLTTLCAVVLAGCGNGFGPEDVAGFYRLVAVDGKGLPNLIQIEANTIPILSGWMQLREDGTCETGIVTGLSGSQRADCVYTLTKQDITVTNEAGGVLEGRTDGVTLLLTDSNGFEWRFVN